MLHVDTLSGYIAHNPEDTSTSIIYGIIKVQVCGFSTEQESSIMYKATKQVVLVYHTDVPDTLYGKFLFLECLYTS